VARPASTRILIGVLLCLLPLLVFHRAILFGEAFLPADLTGHLAPFKAVRESPVSTPWNVLRFDGITEFYPWRVQAAREIQSGRIPLWNPYAFGANGGTPLLANSQSAPLYPLNALFYLFPAERLWYAFGLVAALHLLIAAAGMYRLLRALELLPPAALLGAAVFALSAPVITWLALPTFLAVSCWLPWLLLLIKYAHDGAGTRAGRGAALGTGAVAGMMILAGHLQMAFYGLFAAMLYALWRGIGGMRAGSARPLPWITGVALTGLLAVLLALPQLLPSLELSRISHRASGPPTMTDYAAYTANALPARNFVTLLAPDFFGHPNRNEGFYWNTNNYAEWALYLGIAPLLLASFALALPWRKGSGGALPSERGFFALLGGLALLMALGTPVNLPFFFLVPGYSQTGNPARSLILWAFALAALAAMGLHALLAMPKDEKRDRAALIAAFVPVLLAAIGASLASQFASEISPRLGVTFGQMMSIAMPGIQVAAVLFVLSAATLFVLPRLNTERRTLAASVLILLAIADLALWGEGYNPTAKPDTVYPVTPGIRFLMENGKDALIAPLNQRWSMSALPPLGAVLPPNGLTVYGLHDLQGYDSLFPGVAKEQVKAANGGEDPSPPENGNMVFVKTVEAAKALGAKYIVTVPDAPDLSATGLNKVYPGPDMIIYENPAGRDFDAATSAEYRPASFRFGLFGGLCAVAGLAAGGVAMRLRHRREHG
jgi:hypothetical protein